MFKVSFVIRFRKLKEELNLQNSHLKVVKLSPNQVLFDAKYYDSFSLIMK